MPEAAEPLNDVPCSHCGYRHVKQSGHLRFYVGALQCRVFVQMLLDDAAEWGVKSRPQLRAAPQRGSYSCAASPGFVCFWKLRDGDGVRCGSPDGYTSETPQHEKLQFDRDEDTWRWDDSKLCRYRDRISQRRQEKTGRGARSRGSTPHFGTRANEMPGSGDWRKQRVYTELERRIATIRSLGLTPTPDRIARLGGFTQRA